jgi:hypothetical protein
MTMKLTVEHNIIADLDVLALQLRPSVGAFDLALIVGATMTAPPAPIARRWARLDTIAVHVQAAAGGGHLATLRPTATVRLEQTGSSLTQQFEFQAPLHRRQLLDLESLRDGRDLTVRLSVGGVGGGADDFVGRVPVREDHTHITPRSDWITQLKGAGALGVLLLEASLPLVQEVGDDGIAKRLLSAENAFLNGDYAKCVGDCRLAFDRLGLTARPRTKLAEKQTDMSFAQRLDLLIAAARHCTHPPHHDDADEISEHVYSREEARLVLQISAAALSFHLKT